MISNKFHVKYIYSILRIHKPNAQPRSNSSHTGWIFMVPFQLLLETISVLLGNPDPITHSIHILYTYYTHIIHILYHILYTYYTHIIPHIIRFIFVTHFTLCYSFPVSGFMDRFAIKWHNPVAQVDGTVYHATMHSTSYRRTPYINRTLFLHNMTIYSYTI